MPSPRAWAAALSAWAARKASDWSAWDPDTCPGDAVADATADAAADDAADDAAQRRPQRKIPPPKQQHGGEAKTFEAAAVTVKEASVAWAAWATEREWNRTLYPGTALAEYGTPGGGQGLTVTDTSSIYW